MQAVSSRKSMDACPDALSRSLMCASGHIALQHNYSTTSGSTVVPKGSHHMYTSNMRQREYSSLTIVIELVILCVRNPCPYGTKVRIPVQNNA